MRASMSHDNSTTMHTRPTSRADLIGMVRSRLARLDKLEREGKKIADTQMLRAFIKAVGTA